MDSFFEVLKNGDKYLQTWPTQRVLNCLFIDSKVAFYTRLAVKVMPAFVVLIGTLSIFVPIFSNIPLTMTFIFFLLGLPVQGLYWLGKRSAQRLPMQLLPWYTAIHEKLHGKSMQQGMIVHHPCYFELALLLQNAFKLGGDKFLQHHELL